MWKKVPDPFTLIIFGASGDLTRRKLIPSVYGLFRQGLLPEDFLLVGYARTAKTDESFRTEMGDALKTFLRPASFDAGSGAAFLSRVHYHPGGYDAGGLRSLRTRLEELKAPRNALFDLATPPSAFGPVLDALRETGMSRTDPSGAPWSRVIVEKPFGHDLPSAHELNRTLAAGFAERQIFRIDHYLGKETVQNILVLRFANSIFEPIWNQKYIDHVQITVSETLGVEDRGAFYNDTGAMRDILQNHMMHLLCLMAMEAPLAMNAHWVREKVKLLRSLRPLSRTGVAKSIVRAQYARSAVEGQTLPGYLEEKGVAPGSTTETFVALKAYVDNWRWSGVPFYLRTGKRLAMRVTEIAVHFKSVPQVLFNSDPSEPLKPNVLAIRIQPNEGISLRFHVKVPGPAMEIHPYQMDFGYTQAFGKEPPDAYERLLLDAAVGDSTLFIRNDEVEAAWGFLYPAQEAYAESPVQSLPTYPAGSWGPKEADDLIESDGRKWEIFRRPLLKK